MGCTLLVAGILSEKRERRVSHGDCVYGEWPFNIHLREFRVERITNRATSRGVPSSAIRLAFSSRATPSAYRVRMEKASTNTSSGVVHPLPHERLDSRRVHLGGDRLRRRRRARARGAAPNPWFPANRYLHTCFNLPSLKFSRSFGRFFSVSSRVFRQTRRRRTDKKTRTPPPPPRPGRVPTTPHPPRRRPPPPRARRTPATRTPRRAETRADPAPRLVLSSPRRIRFRRLGARLGAP